MKIGELFVDLFIKTDDSSLKDFIKNLGDLRMSSLLNAVGLDGLYEGIKKIMEVSDRTALSINNFADQTGQSAQEFQKWSKFAEQFGLDANIIGQSIETLEDNIMGLRLTGAGANAYNMIGLDPREFRSYFDLISAIREKMKGLPIETQRFLLTQLGLSKELVQLFNVSDEDWASIKDNTAVSEENLARMKEYHKEINKLSQNWSTLLTHLGGLLAPLVNVLVVVLDNALKIFDKFASWIGPLLTVAGILLKIAGIFNPWIRALTLFGAFLTTGDLLGKSGVFSPAPSQQRMNPGSRINNNRITFTINGENSQDIAKEIDKRLREHLSDAEYQTPLASY